MKAIKTLMAVSVLAAAAGATHAATVATFNVGTTATSIILPMQDYGSSPPTYTNTEIVNPGSGLSTATAVLDDSGLFTVTTHVHVETSVGTNNDLDVRDIFTGSWDGTTFTATSATHEYTGCVDNPPVAVAGCASLASAVGPQPTLAFSGSITLAGGLAQETTEDANSHASTTFKYNFGPGTPATPTVPVPAAAWLFGSGLLGLAGTARRRRAA